jgi:hypothetical protein
VNHGVQDYGHRRIFSDGSVEDDDMSDVSADDSNSVVSTGSSNRQHRRRRSSKRSSVRRQQQQQQPTIQSQPTSPTSDSEVSVMHSNSVAQRCVECTMLISAVMVIVGVDTASHCSMQQCATYMNAYTACTHSISTTHRGCAMKVHHRREEVKRLSTVRVTRQSV